MNNYLILSTEQMDCPICGTTHFVEKRSRTTNAVIKGTVVSYEEIYFFCASDSENDECEFVPAEVMDENLLRARDAYRTQKGLLTSGQIAEIRKTYGLTQSEFSALLGWGEVTITRYETKSIQDETYDRYMRMVKENPSFALQSLKDHRDNFSDKHYHELKADIQIQIDSVGVSFLKQQEVLAQYSAYDEPTEWNGFRLINLEKLGAMMAFFADAFHHVYKVRLMKLLWYADALSFSKRGCAISGLVYCHEQYGALPIGSRDLIYLPSISVVEEEDDDKTKYRISSNNNDFSALDPDELSILKEVVDRFNGKTTAEIVDTMHSESAYLKTRMHEKISFTHCCQLKAFQLQT